MSKAYYNDKKFVKTHWYGDEYEDNWIPVTLMGTQSSYDYDLHETHYHCLIKLKNGKIIETNSDNVYTRNNKCQKKEETE
jgi:hypothetical protein